MQRRTWRQIGRAALETVLKPRDAVLTGYDSATAYAEARADADAMLTRCDERPLAAARIDPRRQPSACLQPAYEVVAFEHRAHVLASLTAWAEATAPNVSVALVTGGPGRGKTRLARQVVRAFENAEADHPSAGITRLGGFLKPDRKIDPARFPTLMERKGALLIVIDYAAQRVDTLEKLLTAAQEAASDRGAHQTRVLLLERGEGDWWDDLQARFGDDAPSLFAEKHVFRLAPLARELTDVQAEFARAHTAFASVIGGAAGDAPDHTAWLRNAGAPDVLDIHAAALLAALGDAAPTEEAATGEDDVIDHLLRHERKTWDTVFVEAGVPGGSIERDQMRSILAWASTAGAGCTPGTLARVLAAWPPCDKKTGGNTDALANALTRAYGEGGKRFEGVRPDRLTTFLTRHLDAAELRRAVPDLAAAVETARDALIPVLRHLTWHHQRHADADSREKLDTVIGAAGADGIRAAWEVAEADGNPAGPVAAAHLKHLADPALAREIYNQVPGKTVNLRELVLEATRVLAGGATGDADRAHLWDALGVRRAQLGDLAGARDAAEEAVGLYRKLARDHPDAVRPGLARSLSNLGNHYWDVGRPEDALAAEEEAVSIRRELAEARPDVFQPDLATSLSNLGLHLAAVGRAQDALAAEQEATAIYRELAEARPDAFQPDLATSLSNLGLHLAAVGRAQDALAAEEEAVAIRRELAEARPDAFRPALASSLSNLGNRLSAVGHPQDALAAAEEATDIYGELAEARPDAFRPDLASSLRNLGIRLANLGHPEEALEAAEEATAIDRELAQARPSAHGFALAGSLGALGQRRAALGNLDGAIAAAHEGIAWLAPIFHARPQAVAQRMAALIRLYLSQCEQRGVTPDGELVNPIQKQLNELVGGEH